MKKKAEITVFLSLIFASICALVCIVIESTKVISMNIQAEALTEVALKSALYEYNIELKDKYGLVFVDTRYHGGPFGDEAFAIHVENYIAENLNYMNSDNLYGLAIENVEIIDAVYANHDSYTPVVNQIIDYENSRGVYGNNNILLDEYLYNVVLAGEEYDEEIISDMTYDDKIDFICEKIENDITRTSGRQFRLSDCLNDAKICAKYSGSNGYYTEIVM